MIATVIGTAAAIAIHGMKQKWRTLYSGLTNILMMNAEIVMGVSLMLLFIAFHVTLGFGTTPDRPYHVQYTLCHTECGTETATDEPT